MSRAKLNRRQLKKISKLARDSSILQKWGAENEEDFIFVVWRGEHTSIEPVINKYGYRSLTCIEILESIFIDKAPWDCDFDVLKYRSLSYANKIHYMIEYLGANNEN